MQREEAEDYLHKKVEDGILISPVLPEGINLKEWLTQNIILMLWKL